MALCNRRAEELLDKAVKLLNEVGQQEPAFGKPLSRATATIETLNRAIANVFLQYQGNGTSPAAHGTANPNLDTGEVCRPAAIASNEDGRLGG